VGDSPLQDRLILIVGSHRSGTTWLHQLVVAHPRIAGVEKAETWVFSGLAALWANVSGAESPQLDTYVTRTAAAHAMRRFCDRAFVATMEDKPSADYFLEKTPTHSWHLDLVSALYPDAWIIHIIRDGRDVAHSGAELDFGPSDVEAAARHWRDTIERVRRDSVLFSRYREVRYEALLADPVGETSELLTWLGLDVDDSVRSQLRERAGERVSQWNTTGPVGSGKWQRLSERDRHAVLTKAGDLLTELGYV
jgi:hypothetical protein